MGNDFHNPFFKKNCCENLFSVQGPKLNDACFVFFGI